MSDEKLVEQKTQEEVLKMNEDDFIEYARQNMRNKEFRTNPEYITRLSSLWRRFV